MSRLLFGLCHFLTSIMTPTYVGFAQAWSVPGYTATVTHSSCNGTLRTVLAISTRLFAIDPIVSLLTFCNVKQSVSNTLVDKCRIKSEGRLCISIKAEPNAER